MNPRQAIASLEHLINNQKTVVTGKLKEPMKVLANHRKKIESENNKLRNKVKRQKNALMRLNDKNKGNRRLEELQELNAQQKKDWLQSQKINERLQNKIDWLEGGLK